MMAAFVMDVNVAIVANGKSPQADAACELACVCALRQIKQSVICLDDGDHIIQEYLNNLSLSGQPGVGDEFMHWLFQNQFTAGKCERVKIHEHCERVFEEFPDDPELESFDRSDRKYVAVALVSNAHPEVMNAVDSDWWNAKESLEKHGLTIVFLCPAQFGR